MDLADKKEARLWFWLERGVGKMKMFSLHWYIAALIYWLQWMYISVRVAHTLFSAKCLPSLLGSCNYLFGRRSSQAFRDFINFQQLIPNFCWCCCLYLVISLGERSNANLGNYRKIWIAWHLARKWLWWRNRWQSEHSPFFMVNSMFTAWLSRDKEVILPGLCHFQATCPWRNCLSILCLTLLICWDNNSVYFVDLWELKNLKCVQS